MLSLAYAFDSALVSASPAAPHRRLLGWSALILLHLARRPAAHVFENPANDCGVIDQGDDLHRRAALGTKLDDPFTLALSLYFASAVAQMLGDVALAAARAESSMQIATEHDLAQPRAWSMGVAGWCRVVNGDVPQGLALARQAVASMQAIQSRHLMTYLMGLLAHACFRAGDEAGAMKVVEDAIAMAEATGERFYDAELFRLRGNLLRNPAIGRGDESAASFRAAIEVARRQGAKTLEQRVIESLRQVDR